MRLLSHSGAVGLSQVQVLPLPWLLQLGSALHCAPGPSVPRVAMAVGASVLVVLEQVWHLAVPLW